MCGIVGILRTSPSSSPVQSEVLAAMQETMCHRGPDDAGLHVDPKGCFGFGFRRLAIIDLSANANQPMTNDDGTVWLVFNGEIYNHAEIRTELQKHGRRFKTDHSDTEVILRGYEQWGEDLLPRLRGMFAFAVWDDRKQSLWLARDRMGVKPLYYTSAAGFFLFASEIKALLAHPAVKRSCNERAFYDFLTFLVSPAPLTLFDGIFKLPASHTMTVHRDGRITQRRYWNPFFGVKSIDDRSEEEWMERVIAKLRESIRYRMVSDVNFGVFLSGGIDSSANVALMAEQMDRPVETFSIGFEAPEKYNELKYARLIVERYKTNHHEIIIKPDDLLRFLPKLVYHQDEPIADPVCVPVYYVSKLAKDSGTTVCQVGEGADELFCGYPYWGMILDGNRFTPAYQMVPKTLRTAGWRLLSAVWPRKDRWMRGLDLLRRVSYDESLFWGGAEAYQEIVKRRFLSDTYSQRMAGYSSYEPVKQLLEDFRDDAPVGADYLSWMAYADLRLRLPELLLMRVDKMTMATSVEARVPFLDQEFVNLAMSIPQRVKYKGRTLKYLLKRAVGPLLPTEIVNRPKQGFAAPIEEWFAQRLRAWADKKIMDFTRRTDYFDPGRMAAYLSRAASSMTWFLLNFVLWHEHWMERRDLDLPVSEEETTGLHQ